MTRDQIETACFNFLNGEEVGNLDATLTDFMENVIDPLGEDAYGDDEDRVRIEEIAREWFEARVGWQDEVRAS